MAAEATHAAMHQQTDALHRQFQALQRSIGFVPKPKLALVRTLGGEQLANPRPGRGFLRTFLLFHRP